MGKSFEKFAGEGVNDADYAVTKFGPGPDGKRTRLWVCPFYEKWMNLMRRTAKDGCQKTGCYSDVEICEEWKTFSNFKKWMEQQDWQGKELDKDLIGTGELYSPETCIFIPSNLNVFISGMRTRRSSTGLPCIYKTPSGYSVRVCGKSGVYRCVHEAIDRVSSLRKEGIKDEWCAYKEMVIALIDKVNYEDHKYADDSPDLGYIAKKPSKLSLRPTRAEIARKRKEDREGLTFISLKGIPYTVEEYINTDHVIVKFVSGLRKVYSWYYVENGLVTDKPLVSKNNLIDT